MLLAIAEDLAKPQDGDYDDSLYQKYKAMSLIGYLRNKEKIPEVGTLKSR